ncbi:MAG: LysE family translocator [Epsilonproteobacteria bacterium]|nr:LysE family translocator [Campylobacterota bacterium]
MTIEFWLVYISVVFMASIIPGPSMLLALTHGIKYGYKRSLSTAFGNMTASILQAMIAISGLSVIFTTSGFLFEVIRWVGAGYLIYMGIMLFRTPTIDRLDLSDAPKESTSSVSMFNQAFLIAMGNPKAILFFTALFPQFVSSEGTPLVQYILMTMSLGIIAFVCMMLYAVAGDKAQRFLTSSLIGKYLNKITGGIFIGAGCGVALKSS